MDGEDHRVVMDLTETLEKVTAGFAHRRMDRALSDTFKDMYAGLSASSPMNLIHHQNNRSRMV